jgi:hypothetical protein
VKHTMKTFQGRQSRTLVFMLAAIFAFAIFAAPVIASDTITLMVNGEGRSASVTSASLQPVDYSHGDQVSEGSISLQIDDRSATNDGWNVTVMASDFTAGDHSISTENFAITEAGEPIRVEGAEIDPIGGPATPNAGAVGPLDTERKVLAAESGSGAGVYDQTLVVELLVPGQTPAGEYTSQLTVNITAGP